MTGTEQRHVVLLCDSRSEALTKLQDWKTAEKRGSAAVEGSWVCTAVTRTVMTSARPLLSWGGKEDRGQVGEEEG